MTMATQRPPGLAPEAGGTAEATIAGAAPATGATAQPRIAVLGAGAVGGFYGGMLARAGAQVTLIGRPAQAEAIGRDGLVVHWVDRSETLRVGAAADPAAAAGADVVLVCVKSPDTEAAAHALQPHLGPDTAVLSLQNGIDNGRRLRTVLPQPVFATVVYVGAVNVAPGVVRHTGRGDLVLGPLAQDLARDPTLLDRARSLAAMFEAAGIPCVVSATIEADLWRKLTINCVYNALSALGQADYGRILAHGPARALIPRIVAECVAVAQADGIALDGPALLAAALGVGEALRTQVSSTAQDVQRGRRTEIDALNGYVAERAEVLGVPAPVNRTLHALVRLREEAQA
jgi:2-dehydropantoate 2-reductase